MGKSLGKTVAIILAGGVGERLKVLTEERSKGAVYFGGKYRLIDFTLCNCVNSGIRQIFVAVQGRDRSLCKHLEQHGKNLSLDINEFLEIAHPQKAAYKGTANAVYENLFSILEAKPERVLILGGDHIYDMDYREMIAFQADKGALIVGVCEVSDKTVAQHMGVVVINENQRIIGFQEKPKEPIGIPGRPGKYWVSMGIYLFPTDTLVSELMADEKKPDSPDNKHDFGKNIIPDMVNRGIDVFAFPFLGYWRDVGTIDSYFEANMELASVEPQFNLYKEGWWTYGKQYPPVKIVFNEGIENSIISEGCIINWGNIRRSILSPGVNVGNGANLSETIVFPDVVIKEGVTIKRAIIDSDNVIPAGSVIEAGNMRYEGGGQKERIVTTESGVVVIPSFFFRPDEKTVRAV